MCGTFLGLAKGAVFALAACFALAAGPTSAATPGELLEKAIYTEETVGDIDEAMKLYEQVIADGKAADEAAAQAQYRLGQCYLKKGNETAAREAFESLVKNFPNATELVAQARKQLPSGLKLLPAPWASGDRFQLNMKLPTGVDIGTMVYMVDAAEENGKTVTRCSTRGLVTVQDANSYSEVFCEPESFRPLRSFWKHSLLGEATAVYDEDAVTITPANKEPFTINFDPPVFDNEQCVELFRRLPLAPGYKQTLSVVTSLGGNLIRIPVTVAGTETLTVPAGTYECYKLELGFVNQTFWISTGERRELVRFAAGGVTADLVRAWTTDSDPASAFDGKNFSFTLPASWIAYAPDKQLKEKPGSEVFLLDPTAAAAGEVEVRPLDTLKSEERESPQAWTESVIGDFKNVFPDFKLREPPYRELTVSGKPATAIVADLTHKGDKKVLYGVAVFGDKSAATLRLMAESDKFDELRPAFDEIVNSFELK